MSTLAKLRETDFSATEKRIAECIIKHAGKMPETTISEVAQACQTSKSMVVQLCKTAGFKGYKNLCRQLRVEQAISGQQGEESEIFEDIHPRLLRLADCTAHLPRGAAVAPGHRELLGAEAIEEAVRLLREADRIMLFGVGGSAIAVLDMYNKLSRIGLNAHFSLDVHCQLLETSAMTERSVALVFSFNGRTKDVFEACELSREAGAKIIAVTRLGRNPLASSATYACSRRATNPSNG